MLFPDAGMDRGQVETTASDYSNPKVEQSPLSLFPRTSPTQDCSGWWLLLDVTAAMVYVWLHHTAHTIKD